MGYRELSDVLWRERQLLDLLRYKLEVERLVVEQRPRLLLQATREVTTAVERLRLAEIERATLSAEVAELAGLPPLSTLAALADPAPDPWRGIFHRHRDAMTEASAEVQAIAGRSRSRLAQLLSGAPVLDLRTATVDETR